MGALRSIGVTGLCLLLLSGCAGTPARRDSTYVVQPHDTLYSIAWRRDLDFRDLARWNRIGPDFRIAVGQVLSLVPRSGAASEPRMVGRNPAPPRLAAAQRPSKAAAPAPVPVPNPAPSPALTASGAEPVAGATAAWVWPTDALGAPRVMPSGGLLIAGRLGQAVRAAAPGRVVYTGSGLRGYGQLVIIKHGETLLSAYAYNRDLLVHEGQEVLAGQPIAAMGQGTAQAAALYFEIRLNGKPTDPLPYLRKK